MSESQQITVLLREWSEGKREALDELLPLVYNELHKQARRYLRKERQGHTLQTTALIHEAYLKLNDQRNVEWESRTHFFAIAAQMMRRILVDQARAKHRDKRGGEDLKLPLEEAMLIAVDEKDVDLIALDEVLTRLEAIDEQQARVVELRYFSGLSLEETAEALKISRATAARDWAMAKAWLHRELTRKNPSTGPHVTTKIGSKLIKQTNAQQQKAGRKAAMLIGLIRFNPSESVLRNGCIALTRNLNSNE